MCTDPSSCPSNKIGLTILPASCAAKIQSIFPVSSSQLTLLGKFLILGKLYLITFTLIVVIAPICKSSKLFILDLSV